MTTVGHTFYTPQSPRRRRINPRTIAKLLGLLIAEVIRQLLL